MSHEQSQHVSGASLGLDTYTVLTPVSDEGIGTVYETYDHLHDRRVLVRVGKGTEAPALRRAFELWCQFGGHPNIVTAFHLREGHDGAVVALEMERCPESLVDRLARVGPLPFAQVLALALGLSSALVELHRNGKVHGTLSPTSVHLSDDERAQIADLGFADIDSVNAAATLADVKALGRVLATALGATVDAGHGGEHRLVGGAELDDIPPAVERAVLSTARGDVASAEECRELYAGLCRHYLGHVPDGIVPRPAHLGPMHAAGPDPAGQDRTDGGGRSRSTAIQQEDRSVGLATPGGADLLRPDGRASPGEARLPDPSIGPTGPDMSVVTATVRPHRQPPTDTGWDDDLEVRAPHRTRRYAMALGTMVACALAAAGAWAISSAGADGEGPARERDGATPTTATSTVPPASDGNVVAPAAPSNVVLELLGDRRLSVTWTDNASVDAGHLVVVRRFRMPPDADSTDGLRAEHEGWIGRAGTVEDRPGDPLPAGQHSIEVELGPVERAHEVITCLAPVAVNGRHAVEAEGAPACVPDGPPAAPTPGHAPVERRAPGPVRVTWTDNSFDESHFVVLEIDPASDLVVARSRATTRSPSEPIELAAGTARCFVVRAENARNRSTGELPVALADDGSSSAPFCFDVG